MIPKKIYLNYVNEEDENKTWSESPVDVSDCEMLNREYTDLSQVWHDSSEEPTENTNVIFVDRSGYCKSLNPYLSLDRGGYDWNILIRLYSIKCWTYLNEVLPKGGEQ